MKRIVLALIVCLWACRADAAFSLVAHGIAASGDGGTSATVTVNSSGADLLVVGVSFFDGAAITVSDSQGGNNNGAPTGLTAKASTVRVQLFYWKNPAHVGASHAFTASASASFPAIAVWAFSGSDLTAPFDVENGSAAATGDPDTPGSVTPGSNNEVVVSFAGANGTPTWGVTLLTLRDSTGNVGSNFAAASADEIQTTATARNPSWSGYGGTQYHALVSATFKAAAGGGGPTCIPTLTLLGVSRCDDEEDYR